MPVGAENGGPSSDTDVIADEAEQEGEDGELRRGGTTVTAGSTFGILFSSLIVVPCESRVDHERACAGTSRIPLPPRDIMGDGRYGWYPNDSA